MDNNLYIDIETTGLDPTKARIVQIGLIYKNKSKSILINPMIPIPEDASRIHHIYDKDVEHSPNFEKVSSFLLSLIEECDCVVGYNNRKYDWIILYIEFLRIGITLPDKPQLDVLELVQSFENTRKLSDVYLRYFSERLDGNHDALNDITATKKILEYLQSKLDIKNP